jgi:hypothetical protein
MEGRADTPIESLCMNTLSLLGSVSIYGSGTSMFGLPCDAGTHILSRHLSQHRLSVGLAERMGLSASLQVGLVQRIG